MQVLVDIESTFLPITHSVGEPIMMAVRSAPKRFTYSWVWKKVPVVGTSDLKLQSENYLFPFHPHVKDIREMCSPVFKRLKKCNFPPLPL